jgi:hypothetical protein
MSQSDLSELVKHSDLSLTDARKILMLLDWQDVGGDYFILGNDKSVRYPIIVALEFEAKRLFQVAQVLRATAGMPAQGGDSDPYSKVFGITVGGTSVLSPSIPKSDDSSEKPRWGGCTVEEFFNAVRRFNQMGERIAALEKDTDDLEQKVERLEEFKGSLAEWLKSLLNPPGSRDWVLKMKSNRTDK